MDIVEFDSMVFPQRFGDPVHKTRFWGLLGEQRLCQHQVPNSTASSGKTKIF